MPSITLAIIGFFGGWCLSIALLYKERTPVLILMKFVVAVGILAAAVVGLVTLSEEARYEWAFNAELSLIDNRFVFFLVWFTLGLIFGIFRSTILTFTKHLRDLLLVQTTPQRPARGRRVAGQVPNPVGEFENKSFPWFVEWGLLIAIIAVIILAFNPSIIKSVTSLKAGEFEADFGKSTIVSEKAQVSVVDANNLSTTTNWSKFSMDNNDSVRIMDYSNAGGPSWRMNFSKSFLKNEIVPFFQVLACVQVQGIMPSPEVNEKLRKVAFHLSAQILHDTLQQGMNKSMDFIHKEDMKVSEIVNEMEGFVNDYKGDSDTSSCKKLLKIEDGVPWMKNSSKITNDDLVFNNIEEHQGRLENIWDPYVIEAAADMLGLVYDKRSQEDFLVQIYGKINDNKSFLCDQTCKFVYPGQLSFMYALLSAKIQSERPWQFEPMVQQMEKMLWETNIAAGRHSGAMTSLQRTFYLKSRLIDLSLGLQLFYQRALYSQRFSPAELQVWRDWLSETRNVVNLLSGVGTYWPLGLDEDRRLAWQNAGDEIRSDPAILQDAATSAAMSSILLPLQSGAISGSDCTVARAMMIYASREKSAAFPAAMHFSQEDKGTYLGLVEQMTARIGEECAAL